MLTLPVFQLSYLTPAGHKKTIVHTYRNQSSRQIAPLSLSKEKNLFIYLFIFWFVWLSKRIGKSKEKQDKQKKKELEQ